MSNEKEEKVAFQKTQERNKIRLNPALKSVTQGEQWKLGTL